MIAAHCRHAGRVVAQLHRPCTASSSAHQPWPVGIVEVLQATFGSQVGDAELHEGDACNTTGMRLVWEGLPMNCGGTLAKGTHTRGRRLK